MLLTVDIGNTNITFGLFEDDNFVAEYRLPSDKDLSVEEYETLLVSIFRQYSIKGAIIASVVEGLGEKLKSAIDFVFKIESLNIDKSVDLGIKICTDNPSEVGADRIANAVAVSILYNSAVIVVDFGTATTFDVINSKKEFLGGIIAPGINTQLKCLNLATSKLPKIDVTLSTKAIGSNTVDAILSGVIRGTACMIDGMITQCKKELGEPAIVVATGGYCGLIANYLEKPFDSIHPTLTLCGLNYLYKKNRVDNCLIIR